MPDINYLQKLVLPINVEGTITNVEYTIKDAEARQMIEDLGHALYWMGVTTTEMSDGLTTADVTINGETVTPNIGGLVSYSGSEFVWNGSAWQELGKNNFGALAFKSSASGSYTPAGTITVTDGADTTTNITPLGSAGTAPSWSVSNETATFNAGSAATAGTAVDVVTASGARTASFEGTAATITVS
ncbi:MAG: hypothetical protein IKP50_00555 [Bacilli bacterium]|nr:hypothetical protein [Bacilli bacterium]